MGMARTKSAVVVLVTGSSSGIGKAICDQLGGSGARVYGGSRLACTPRNWTSLNIDVTDDAAVQAAVGTVMGREGRIDALVSCAGVSLAGPIEDTSIEEAKWQFETNFYGTVRLIRAVLPGMRKQASGKIIVIGSIGGLIGLPYLGYYSAAKFALDGLVEALRTEIAPFGIQACVLHPGAFRTAMDANEVFARLGNALAGR
jgi:NAD(P)-dependent dehydrogenase (short-subunit alcohol dehydrogenase family)